jgi:hypothetical protein
MPMRVDLASLRREHSISANSMVKISYVRTDGGQVEATVTFAELPTRFGGRRLWFRCPSCPRICRILFGSWRIACRRCHKLRYLTQAETRSSRAIRGMLKIVKRLDPEATYNALPPKPKGMHWRTYDRLADRYDTYDAIWAMGVMRFLRIRVR